MIICSKANLERLIQSMMKLHNNFSQSLFKPYLYNGEYWVSLLASPESKKIAIKALQQLLLMKIT